MPFGTNVDDAFWAVLIMGAHTSQVRHNAPVKAEIPLRLDNVRTRMD